MSNLKKLNKLIADKNSSWKDEALKRSENDDWLSDSFDIAICVLDTLRNKKMTQKDLADRMDVSPQFINKIVKGQENLSLETIGKLNRALGIKLIQVLNFESTEEVEFDHEQAYEVSQAYREEIFRKASAAGFEGLKAIQQYVRGQKLEYKIQVC